MRQHTDEQAVLAGVDAMLRLAGRNPASPDLLETASRYLRSWSELTSGTHVDVPSLFKTFDRPQAYNEMIVVSDIPVVSLCEHHLLPWYGTAVVGYIPGERIVGLSKLARCVDAFCRRPQVQERATQQIAEAIAEHLQPRGVGVILTAQHACMSLRGAKAMGSTTRTAALLGVFREAAVRQEFYSLSQAKS